MPRYDWQHTLYDAQIVKIKGDQTESAQSQWMQSEDF